MPSKSIGVRRYKTNRLHRQCKRSDCGRSARVAYQIELRPSKMRVPSFLCEHHAREAGLIR